MKSIFSVIGLVLLICGILLASISCSSSSGETDENISSLETRVSRLEQGLDERAAEYNVIESALYQMIVENNLIDKEWANLEVGSGSSNWRPTNDMRRFPNASHPLYGYDKNNDGNPDTNYVAFEKSQWFYDFYDRDEYPILGQYPDMGWTSTQYEDRPSLDEADKDKAGFELNAVQTSVDAYMAVNQLTTITARTTAAVIASGNTDAPFKVYLRQLPTAYCYIWMPSGTVTQLECP